MTATTRDTDIVTAAIVVIGDEILSGRTKDKNIGFIADYLTTIGIDLCEVRIVADDLGAIVEAVNAVRARYNYVFTTGGIGPTHDDITCDAIAAAFDVEARLDERIVAILRKRYSKDQMTPGRLRMARTPQGAELIPNAISALPGFSIENVYVLAGVPAVMQAMFDALAPTLATGKRMLSTTIEANRPEGIVAVPLEAIQNANPQSSIGSYPYFDGKIFTTRIVVRARDQELVDKVAREVEAMLDDLSNTH